jgi:asparagine synthase (glutamine-hydrolysing)
MANAVEGRFPFLDHRLVELAAQIPPRLKLRGLTEKHVLREAARTLVPARMAARPKQPYRAPDCASFCASGAPDYVGSLLSGPAIAASGLFERSAVEKLARKAFAGRASGFRDNVALTGILSTQLWHETFVLGGKRASILSRQKVA